MSDEAGTYDSIGTSSFELSGDAAVLATVLMCASDLPLRAHKRLGDPIRLSEVLEHGGFGIALRREAHPMPHVVESIQSPSGCC
jgi:hypothetical protein